MPGVELGLQVVALGQQGPVLRGQVGDDLVGARPEALGVDAGTGKRFVVTKSCSTLATPQIADGHAIGRGRARLAGLVHVVSSLKASTQLTRG